MSKGLPPGVRLPAVRRTKDVGYTWAQLLCEDPWRITGTETPNNEL